MSATALLGEATTRPCSAIVAWPALVCTVSVSLNVVPGRADRGGVKLSARAWLSPACSDGNAIGAKGAGGITAKVPSLEPSEAEENVSTPVPVFVKRKM